MEGRRPPIALLFLALVLAAGSLGAVAQLYAPAGKPYMLLALQADNDDRTSLVFRTDPVAIPGFANKTNHWFAVTGTESLVPAGYSYGGDVPAADQGGLSTLLRVLAKNGTR